MRKLPPGAWSWAFYDWANNAFALNILVAIYPFFFGAYLAAGMEAAESTYWLGLSASLASLIVAVLAPLLGTIADLGGSRKRLLFFFTVVGVLATAALYLVEQGAWGIACAVYILGTISFSFTNLFYDALLPAVSSPENRHKISGIGFSMGYLGSVMLLIGLLVVIMNPEKFGFEDAIMPTKLSFLLTAAWWAVFAVPLFLNVPEGATVARLGLGDAIRGSLRQLWLTAREILKIRPACWFLVAYWFYIDGVNTIIKMAGKLGADLGIDHGDLIGAIILVQVVGVPCAFLFGWLGQRFGPRPMLLTAIGIYLIVTWYASVMTHHPVSLGFMSLPPVIILGFLIGSVQGGIQSLSRSFFISLIPDEKAASFFGFYNVVGKSAAVVGPWLVGWIAFVTGDTQVGIRFLTVFFILGAGFLLMVKAPRR